MMRMVWRREAAGRLVCRVGAAKAAALFDADRRETKRVVDLAAGLGGPC